MPRQKIYSLAVFMFFAFMANAQTKTKFIVKEIIVDESGIYAVSANENDTLTTDVKTNSMMYCYSDTFVSFWYKIFVRKPCELRFDVLPSSPDNIYYYYLYKGNNDINVSDVLLNKSAPMKGNLFRSTSDTFISL